ncbi:MAG: hypothetical protein ACI9BO_001171 [Zhongshania sp.]|jgi:hypothetical protein
MARMFWSCSPSISAADSDEIIPLSAVLKQCADILQVLNLSELANSLNQHANALLALIDCDLSKERARLEDLAETLLFIDGSLAQIDRCKLNYADLGDLSLERRDAISNDNQVSEARSIVIEESKAAIGLVERAISAHIKSGFDSSLIAYLPQLMNSVRGAFEMIDVPKLPEVTRGAASFLNEFVDRKRKNSSEDVQALETLADAMISIEYFLNELGRRHIADERILQFVEDSVSALKAYSAST